jgi:hypothetical protein
MKRVRIARAGKELGEYTEDQVRQYLASGNLVPGDYGWVSGMTGWKTLSELGYLAATDSPPPPPGGQGSGAPVNPRVTLRGIQPRGSYIKESMARDEVLLYEANVSWAGFYALLTVFGTILAIVSALSRASHSSGESVGFVAVVGGLTCLIVYVSLSATELGVTNRRVIAKIGVISRKAIEVRNDKIEGIQIDQPILGRIFNFGSVTVRGSGQTEVPLHAISDPLAFRRAVDEVAGR